MTYQELFEGVCECIRQTLEKDLPEIRESDRLIADLGADSLDFLDLIFRLEERFSAHVNPRELERRAQEKLGDTPMIVNERYTEAAIAELRKALPEVPEDELFPDMPVNKLPETFRVKTFMNLVAHVLEEEKPA
ncbi:MAG: acyl carrier protein [Zoogloeaceae bacterium]|jgi:acyl carrier protein|nr:acyl carrier protein [Zoogloeaceae bacterium]